jgi:glycerophosphoryl diester phosphodiesterase
MQQSTQSFPKKPFMLGHRGAPNMARENTIAAYRAALDAGLDGLEIDLQFSSDGVLVLHHDDDLAGPLIRKLTWLQIQMAAPDTPRFEELLELLEEYPQAWLNIELKSPGAQRDGREAALAQLMRGWQGSVAQRSWISTFDPVSLILLDELKVGIPLAFLVSNAALLRLLPCLPVKGIHPHHSLATRERVQEWHEQGLFVIGWTVNDPELGREMLAAGLDGLIGDEPEVLLGMTLATPAP